MHEGEKINKRLCKFFIEIFEFTDKQLAAIDYQIPMTQEIYDSVLDRCMELGTAADDLFYRMLLEYPADCQPKRPPVPYSAATL